MHVVPVAYPHRDRSIAGGPDSDFMNLFIFANVFT